jgi:hypothetical protein
VKQRASTALSDHRTNILGLSAGRLATISIENVKMDLCGGVKYIELMIEANERLL